MHDPQTIMGQHVDALSPREKIDEAQRCASRADGLLSVAIIKRKISKDDVSKIIKDLERAAELIKSLT